MTKNKTNLELWRDVYYPTNAKDASDDPLKAAEHSLRKWLGTRPEILKKFGLRFENHRLWDRNRKAHRFDSASCALCQYEERLYAEDLTLRPCQGCPFTLVHGRFCGDEYSEASSGNVEPMINRLQQVVVQLKLDPSLGGKIVSLPLPLNRKDSR